MNNKGFTLVELLAVLVVLTTILLIAIPSITSSVERNKEKIRNKKINIIENAGYQYAKKYKNVIPEYNEFINGSCYIDINDIKNVGLISDEDRKDADDNIISGYLSCKNDNIQIDGEGNSVEKFVCSYIESVALDKICEDGNNE